MLNIESSPDVDYRVETVRPFIQSVWNPGTHMIGFGPLLASLCIQVITILSSALQLLGIDKPDSSIIHCHMDPVYLKRLLLLLHWRRMNNEAAGEYLSHNFARKSNGNQVI